MLLSPLSRLLFLVAITCNLLSCEVQQPAEEISESKSKEVVDSIPCPDSEVLGKSLLGKPLCAPVFSDEYRIKLENNLTDAKKHLESHLDDPEAKVWVGRRLAYLGKHHESIEFYSKSIQEHPNFAPLYRHRGHRYFVLRMFDEAIQDFEKATTLFNGYPDEVEQDGIPNSANIPISTLQTNSWHHLGLSYYMLADFDKAEYAFLQSVNIAPNADMLCASTIWLYYTLIRQGRGEEARDYLNPIVSDMKIYEYSNYYQLLQDYKLGNQESYTSLRKDTTISNHDRAVLTYGLVPFYLGQGDLTLAIEVANEIVDYGNWTEFAVMAAEAEVKNKKLTKGGS